MHSNTSIDNKTKHKLTKDKIIGFVWQHILLMLSMFFMTFGVALCVRSNLGSGVISSIPMAFSLAGEAGLAPGWTIGGYTNIMNVILVVAQILILRRRFEPLQLFQLLVGFIFGAFLDINMIITSFFSTYEARGLRYSHSSPARRCSGALWRLRYAAVR